MAAMNQCAVIVFVTLIYLHFYILRTIELPLGRTKS